MKITLQNSVGNRRTVKQGFSWTIFFFGWIALIVRGQGSKALIGLVLTFFFVFPGILYGWYIAFKGNRDLIDDLISKGYVQVTN